ncbi:MAG: methionine--tRNA ligase subunit beta [Patescibacteria group bacterium]|nr:methionine--tRNA ligase subunit beta [Patescibacteria group bacterium]
MDLITFEDFKKVEVRIGKVLACEKVQNADKLLKLQVDFGDFQRQIVSGIAESFTPEELVGKKLPFIVNLEYRKFKGEESQGMLMAIDADDKTVLLEPSEDVLEGTEVV